MEDELLIVLYILLSMVESELTICQRLRHSERPGTTTEYPQMTDTFLICVKEESNPVQWCVPQ